MVDFQTSAQRQAYWDSVYSQVEAKQPHENQQSENPSLNLINLAELAPYDRILDVGAGNSSLIKALLEQQYEKLLAVDISEKALTLNQQQIGEQAEKVKWVVDDVTNSQQLHELDHVALWHDRGLFHYLTDFKERLSYFSLMNRMVREEGYVILGASTGSAETDGDGLPVRAYDLELMKSFMGPGYYLLESHSHVEKTAQGVQQPMLYALFKRVPFVDMQ